MLASPTDQIRHPTVEPRITAGAARMRKSRERRRNGMRCVQLDLRDTEIDRLISLGYLQRAVRDDRNKLLLAPTGFWITARSVIRILDRYHPTDHRSAHFATPHARTREINLSKQNPCFSVSKIHFAL